MRITMLESRRGSDNGIHVHLYEKGQTYEVGDILGHAFIAEGFARRARVCVAKPALKRVTSPKHPC